MYHYIFFDLDGTLTDSQEGILNCLRYAFEKLGKPVPPEAAQDLKVFPLEELLAALEQYVEEFLAVPNKYIP